jgi:hypothetical protein
MTKKKPAQKKQAGFTYTLEIIFVATILVIGLLAGWVQMRDTALGEMSDIARAIGALNQSFTFNGTSELGSGSGGIEATITAGSLFNDNTDTSDNIVINVGVQPTRGESDGIPFGNAGDPLGLDDPDNDP